jgi:NTE family protein
MKNATLALDKSQESSMRIGLALGGGGARGLAHIPMLEVLDELEVQPAMICGTSIGAVVGSLYATGMSAAEIRSRFAEIIPTGPDQSFMDQSMGWFRMARIQWGEGLLNVDRFLEALFEDVDTMDFQDLRIPLKVVTADFWNREQVVIESGHLVDAVRASMALPGIFRAETRGDQVLVDGGCVNPVPFDLLHDCEVTIGIDVLGDREAEPGEMPNLFEAMFQTYQIMAESILRGKLVHTPPSIFLSPPISGIRMLDFHKAHSVFQQAETSRDQLRQDLLTRMERIG